MFLEEVQEEQLPPLSSLILGLFVDLFNISKWYDLPNFKQRMEQGTQLLSKKTNEPTVHIWDC